MSNETWHNCSANIIFGLIPFAYLAGHQSPKVRIKVTAKIMQQDTTLVLIWRPILIPDHRIVRIVWKLGFKWCSQANKFQKHLQAKWTLTSFSAFIFLATNRLQLY